MLGQKIKQKIKLLINKGGIHVIIGSFCTKFISFFGSIFLVRLLTKEEYGVLSYWENFLGYFIIIAGLGLAVGIQRFMVLANSIGRKKDCFIYSFKRGTKWNLLLVLIFWFFCFFYPHPVEFRGYYTVMIVLGLCIPFIFIDNLCLISFRALFDHKRYAYLAFTSSALIIVFRVFGAGLGGINLSVIFRFSAEILSVCLFLHIIHKIHFKSVKYESNPKSFVKELNKYSFQMMLTDGLWAIFMLNDTFLLGQFSGESSIVADYKVAVVIPANLAILTASIGIFVAPYFTIHEKDRNWVKKNLISLIILTISIVGLAAVVCTIFSEAIITIIYGEQYKCTASLMSILLIASFISNGIRATIANVLSAMGKQKVNLTIGAIGVVLQLILDIKLIPQYGAVGVAWSSVIVYSVMTSILLYYTFMIYLNKKVIND